MSRTYFVETALGISFTKGNIKAILKKGHEIGFIYYDHICGERYEDSPILNYVEIFNKWEKAVEDSETDHSLYVEIAKGHFAHLWIYKTGKGYLRYDFSIYSHLKEKFFEDSHRAVDFKFYIDIALKLGDDFGIEKLVADHMD